MDSSMISDLPPCLIYIDKQGHWFHKGVEMIRRDYIRMFYMNMELDSEGHYIINWNGKKCYVEVEDTAFVVKRTSYQEKPTVREAVYILSLSDDTKEELIPETLHIGKDNVMYCRIKNNAFPARFTRSAYYQLTKHIIEENNKYYLPFKGKNYLIYTEGKEG
ncbi:MAG: hypothetical protein B1H11_05390 [Desulfobacteraceae bacterium 4484_190.1]|nr:MAG: hypothetical protein B1H11_05390 [Desulfobacteraceae bacterium 4484_190.1]